MVRFYMVNGKSNGEVYKLIDKAKLDVVSKPIAESHGLPNECYISQEYTKIERKKLFEDKWIVIGAASSLPNKGDAKPFNLLDLPIIILRDIQELSYEDISKIIEVPIGTVKSRINRGREKLYQLLKGKEII